MGDLFEQERHKNVVNEYSPAVRVAYWNEDLIAEEELLRSVLEKIKDSGSMMQTASRYLDLSLQHIALTENYDGFLHDGDIVMLQCCCRQLSSPIYLAALPSVPQPKEPLKDKFDSPCEVSATPKASSRGRSVVAIYREDNRIPTTVPIMYGEYVSIQTAKEVGRLKMESEPHSFIKYAKKSKHQLVQLVEESSSRTLWKFVYKFPRYRMEKQSSSVPVNEDVIINHVATNRNLAVEPYHKIKTVFGTEWEVSGHNYLNTERVETELNHWQIISDINSARTSGRDEQNQDIKDETERLTDPYLRTLSSWKHT